MTEVAVSVDGVSKRFRMYRERNQSLKAAILRGRRGRYDEFWALKDVSIKIEKGSTYGLIGENGSGKSTLLKCIAKILQPDSGSIVSTGSLAALLELGSGFHPELSGRDNVYLNASILGMRRADIDAAYDRIVDFSGVAEFINQPVKNYSSGMYVRLAFSVAINIDPEILLVDEVLAVGDANFQDKCMEKFAEFRRRGKTVVIVSHGMSVMRSMCDDVTWLEHGKVVANGDASTLVDDYVDNSHSQRTSDEPRGDRRWGSGEIRITKMVMLDSRGLPTTEIHTGSEMTFRIEYDASERIDRPIFGLALQTLQGVVVWENNSGYGTYLPPAVEGAGSVDFTVPGLMLQPGTFDLIGAICDHTTTHFYDFVRDALRFDVLTGTPREQGGIVTLGGSWSGRVDSTLLDGSQT